MAVVLEEVFPGFADYDGLLVVFTWAVAVPAPIIWRSIYSPTNSAAAELPPDFRMVTGINGEAVLVQEHNTAGSFRCRFLASSPTVAQIEVARHALRVSARRGGPFAWPPFTATDLNSPGRFVSSARAMIEGPPRSIEFGRAAPVLEYTFLCDGMDAFFAPLIPR